MKKSFVLVYALCIFPFMLSAQKEIYLDSLKNEISLSEFGHYLSKNKMGWAYYVQDSTYYYVPTKFYKLGKIGEDQLGEIQKVLKSNYNLNLMPNQTICLYYLGDVHYKFKYLENMKPGDRGHFSDYETARSYKYRKVSKDKLIAINLHGRQILNAKFYEQSKLTKIDALGLVKAFFDISFPYHSQVYIKPSGHYLIIYGVGGSASTFRDQIKIFIDN